MAIYDEKNSLMNRLSSNLTEGDARFPGDLSVEDIDRESEQDVNKSRGIRYKQLTDNVNALSGLLRAQGEKADPKIVQQLEAAQREKATIEKQLNIAPFSEKSSNRIVSASAPSPVSTLSEMKTISKTTNQVPEPVGMGPFASGEKYGSLLDRLKEAEVEAPTGKPKTLTAALGAAPGSKGPETEPQAAPTPSPYETEMSRLKEERATAREEQQTEMDRLAKGELASLIGRSLTQIGAAATGMQKGIDMSGVAQKELVDWDKRRTLIASQYEQRVKELEADRARLERVKERTDDRAERAAIAQRQEALAKEERNFKAAEAVKDREAEEALELLKAYKDKNPEAIKKIQGRAALKVKQIDRKITALDKIDGMFESYAGAPSDKKKAEETKIRQALRTLMGAEAVAGEKKSFLGFEYDDKKSVDQIIEDVAKYKTDLESSRDIQEQLSLGLEERPTSATVETPAAAPVQETELQRKERRRQELLNKAKGQ